MRDGHPKKKKPLVFAYPVNDITMGRYLAAKEVDFIGIDFNSNNLKESTSLFYVLQSWIEGPLFIAVVQDIILDDLPIEMDGFAVHEMNKYSSEKIYIWKAKTKEEVGDVSDRVNYILCEEMPDDMDQVVPSEKILLKYSMTQPLIMECNIAGYWIDPGGEQETGIADFESLEKFFDALDSF